YHFYTLAEGIIISDRNCNHHHHQPPTRSLGLLGASLQRFWKIKSRTEHIQRYNLH
ncbi:hypothetical protein M5D96_009182, partial [Drosophila gunungcola]